jgi:hypothetical protein
MASTRADAKGNSGTGDDDVCYLEMLGGMKLPIQCKNVPPADRKPYRFGGPTSGTDLAAKVAIPTLLAGGVAYGVSNDPVVSLGAAAAAGVASYFFLSS